MFYLILASASKIHSIVGAPYAKQFLPFPLTDEGSIPWSSSSQFSGDIIRKMA